MGRLFIKDIYASVQHIKKFVGKMNRREFLADEDQGAVAFKIENIGEASRNIPEGDKGKYNDIHRTEMARMRG